MRGDATGPGTQLVLQKLFRDGGVRAEGAADRRVLPQRLQVALGHRGRVRVAQEIPTTRETSQAPASAVF